MNQSGINRQNVAYQQGNVVMTQPKSGLRMLHKSFKIKIIID
jgi:hypothetical protein